MCVPSARHLFGTASLASSALSASAELLVFQLTLITNKDYFSRKKLNLEKFTVAVYVIYIYGRDVTHWCQ